MIRHSRHVTIALVLSFLAVSPARAQTLPVVFPPVSDPLLANLTIPATATTQGMWSPVMPWPLVSIHTALLPDGTVLTYGSPIGQGVQDGRVFDRWDPLNGSHAPLPRSQHANSVCSSGSLQTSGALLVSGGNTPRDSTLFRYGGGSAATEVFRLASDRWYASMIMLADGRSLMTGGALPYAIDTYVNPAASLGRVSMTPEVYTPGIGWSSLVGATSRDAFGPDFNRWWYPRNWVAPNGEVFGISSEKMWYLNPAGDGAIRTVGTFKGPVNNTTRPNIGPTSTAVMYDIGKILQVGGNGYTNGFASNSSALATTFDITHGDPVVVETAAMLFPRQWANTTVLPTGRVLVNGGTRFADNGGADAVFTAEWWNPPTRTWSPLASAQIIRNYHSSSILLPNGTVLTSGGGVPGPVTNLNAEIFYPPYLFRTLNGQAVLADQPRMISASATRLAYGASAQIEMADTRAIAQVVLIGVSSTTHSFNMGQRYLPVSFSQTGAMLTVTVPASAYLAPPGYYLVFAVDATRVPSRGQIVALGGAAAPTDLVVSYPFDQTAGTTVLDASGNGLNGVLRGGASWTTGRTGNAVRIAGGAQYVDLPDGMVRSCTDLTVAVWVRLTSNPTWGRILDFGNDTGTNMFLTARAGGPTVRFAMRRNGGTEQRISYGFNFPLNQWMHVAVVLAGNTGRLYLNGALVAQNASFALNPADMGATVNNWLGRSQYPDPNLNGSLEELRVSCRAFSGPEISALAR